MSTVTGELEYFDHIKCLHLREGAAPCKACREAHGLIVYFNFKASVDPNSPTIFFEDICFEIGDLSGDVTDKIKAEKPELYKAIEKAVEDELGNTFEKQCNSEIDERD